MSDAPPVDEALPPRHRPWYRKKRYLLPILLVVTMVVLGAMFGDPSPSRVSPAELAASPADPGEPRCEPAAPFVLDAITDGLIDVEMARLAGGQAVRSRDYQSLWFIATEVRGPDLPQDATALWAVDRNDARLTTIFAVGELADDISLWGDVVVAEDPPQPSDDGAQQARDCLEQAS